jgi:hypothetical protein
VLVNVHHAAAQSTSYVIDSNSSWIRIIEGVPSDDAATGFTVLEGTRFANTIAVLPQADGSLQSNFGGRLEAQVSGATITFAGGSIMDVHESVAAPFLPASDAVSGTGSLADEDNFGGVGAFIREDNVIAQLALRDAVADITAGSATIGGPVTDLEFTVTSGVLDFAVETLGLAPTFLDLPPLLSPVRNLAEAPFTGSLAGTITIPLNLDFTLDIFSPGDSRLVVEGLIVAKKAALTPGDYNGNGQVEQADLDLVLLNWGATLPDPIVFGWSNDLPSGAIDQEELDGVLLKWGNSAALGTESVPEPAALALLVSLFGCWVGYRGVLVNAAFEFPLAGPIARNG